VSQEEKDEQVVVDNKKEGNIYLGDIEGGKLTQEKPLRVGFKTGTKAKFKVLYASKPLAAAIKEINLSTQTPHQVSFHESYYAQGSKRKATYKLEQAVHSTPIDLSKLSIVCSKRLWPCW
jgi:hypothetical protein